MSEGKVPHLEVSMFDKAKRMLDAVCRSIARPRQSENRPVFRWAKPGLEWLEKRIVPTVTWVGNTSSDWATAANWRAGFLTGEKSD